MNILDSRIAVKAIKSIGKPTKERMQTGILGLVETLPKRDIKQFTGDDEYIPFAYWEI